MAVARTAVEAEDADLVASRGEMRREGPPEEAGAAGEDDGHGWRSAGEIGGLQVDRNRSSMY